MRPLTVEDAREMVLALQDEIRRSEQARYDHRLHGVLLVAQGMSAPKVARLLGDGVRTVEYWVERFNNDGLAGLVEGERPGRPSKLSIEQLQELEVILRASPREQGVSANLWDGKTLSHWIRQQWGCESGHPTVPTSVSKVGISITQAQAHGWARGSRIAKDA